MSHSKPEILRKETYLKMIENSVGSRLFNSLIAKQEGKTVDLLNNGELSCAAFVSNILFINKMLDIPSATVNSLEKKLIDSPHYENISTSDYKPAPGDIVIWEGVVYGDGEVHRHAGFVFNKKAAISTSYKQKCVTKHSLLTGFWFFKKARKLERVFRYKF